MSVFHENRRKSAGQYDVLASVSCLSQVTVDQVYGGVRDK